MTRFEATVLRLPERNYSVPVIVDWHDRTFITFQTSEWNKELAEDFAKNPGLVGTFDWRPLPSGYVEAKGDRVPANLSEVKDDDGDD